ncbi:aldo/keto reductase [Microbacterium sp.]|uniref:aldo/keto reductase n=1 Tax=Microbacterium sp. TaxID=51671 RepID=UPI0039E306D4
MTPHAAGRLPHLTRVGLGGAQLGNLSREIDDEQAEAVVDAAWAEGIRSFDTAPHYGLGLSERRLGRALRKYPRDEYVLSTKVGRLLVDSPETAHRLDDGGFAVPAAMRRTWDFTRDGILRSLEGSLDRLGLDRVDIVYLHDPDDHWQVASTEGMATLIELRDQGAVTAVGVGMNQSAMPAEFIRRSDIDVVMLAGRYTLLEQPALRDLLPLAAQRGVAVVNVGVYNSGLLARARVSPGATYDYLPAPADLVERAEAIADICDRWGVSLPDVAMQFAIGHRAIASAVVGCRTPEQVVDAVARASAVIPPQLWRDLVQAGLLDADAEATLT